MTKRFIILYIILLSSFVVKANGSTLFELREHQASKVLQINYCLLDGEMFVQNVWSVIDSSKKENYPIFFPHNKIPLISRDNYPYDYTNSNLFSIGEINSNHLWNIILKNFLTGDVMAALPYNPEWLENEDRGFLTYKITPVIYGQGHQAYNYFTDSIYRNFIHAIEILGYTDFTVEPMPVMSLEYDYEDSIDYNGNVVYYPRPYIWYEDKDIVSYQIKESWSLDKKAKVISKKIDAIAPVVNLYDPAGNISGQKLLFWVDFSMLEPFLKEHHVVVEVLVKGGKKEKDRTEKKVVSFAEYFNDRHFNSEILEADSLHVKLVENDSLKTE